MKTVLLATFQELEPAQQLQTRLKSAGITSTIQDDSRLQRMWFIHTPIAPYHVEVLREDFENASRTIRQWSDTGQEIKGALCCPSCHSLRVEFPQITRKFVLPSIGSLLMAIGLVPREFYCVDCQYTWPPVIHRNTPEDSLGWPVQSKLWHKEQQARKS
jgi:hypothetical protein